MQVGVQKFKKIQNFLLNKISFHSSQQDESTKGDRIFNAFNVKQGRGMGFKTRETKKKEQTQIMAKNKWGKGFDIVVKEELALNLTSNCLNIETFNAKIKEQIAKEGMRHLE